MSSAHYIHQAAAELRAEASSNAREVAAALAPPDDAHDAVKVSDKEAARIGREQSMRDPNFLATKLEQMAPVVATLPGGTPLRAANGVKKFVEYVKLTRPDVYGHVTGDLRPLERYGEAQGIQAPQEAP